MDLQQEIEAVNAEIEATREHLNGLNRKKDALQAQTEIKCGACEASHPIKDLVYIQGHWYESPHGCMGGDTWHADQYGQTQCPSCGARLSLYQMDHLCSLKRLFKEIKEEHKR